MSRPRATSVATSRSRAVSPKASSRSGSAYSSPAGWTTIAAAVHAPVTVRVAARLSTLPHALVTRSEAVYWIDWAFVFSA